MLFSVFFYNLFYNLFYPFADITARGLRGKSVTCSPTTNTYIFPFFRFIWHAPPVLFCYFNGNIILYMQQYPYIVAQCRLLWYFMDLDANICSYLFDYCTTFWAYQTSRRKNYFWLGISFFCCCLCCCLNTSIRSAIWSLGISVLAAALARIR